MIVLAGRFDVRQLAGSGTWDRWSEKQRNDDMSNGMPERMSDRIVRTLEQVR